MAATSTSWNSETARAARAKCRPRGPSKIPADFRAGVMQSYINRGGVKWLDSLSDELFVRVFTQCLPKNVTLSGPGLEELLTRSWAERSLPATAEVVPLQLPDSPPSMAALGN